MILWQVIQAAPAALQIVYESQLDIIYCEALKDNPFLICSIWVKKMEKTENIWLHAVKTESNHRLRLHHKSRLVDYMKVSQCMLDL